MLMGRCYTTLIKTLAAFGALTLLAGAANAQWHSDSTVNAIVCDTANTQIGLKVCSDGANGAIVVWEDYRSGYGWDIYAQHIDQNGNRTWGTYGVPVCNRGASDQRHPVICTDDNGGAYIVWEDNRTTANSIDLYAEHINSAGVLTYSTKDGVVIGSGIRDQKNAAICRDGSGNAFVAWEDYRNSVASSQPDIYMNKLTTGGAGWGNGGTAKITQANKQFGPKLVDDGNGGCFLAWQNLNTVPGSIWGTRISSSGTVQWGYQGQGVTIYKASNFDQVSKNIDVNRDGNKFLITWETANPSGSSNGQDILANKINMDSTVFWYSPAEVTGSAYNDQTNPRIFSDDSNDSFNGSTGLMVFFEDNTRGSFAPVYYETDISARRILASGADVRPGGSSFYPVCWQTRTQSNFQAVDIGNGEYFVAWQDGRTGNGDSAIYVQHIDRTGKRYFPTAGTNSSWGQAVMNTSGRLAKDVQLVARNDGAIVVWADNRSGNNGIYAQLVFKNGTLPIELAGFTLGEENNAVRLDWKTVSEKDNAGFEIERRRIDELATSNVFEPVASYRNTNALRGSVSSNTERHYTYLDDPGAMGTYEYRLVNVDLNGTRHESEPKSVELQSSFGTSSWYIGQNQPNPFKDHTSLMISMPQQAAINVTVTDVLGRVVATPVNGNIYTAGEHHLALTSAMLGNLTPGTYFYTVTANDPATHAELFRTEKARMIQVIK